jgi:serine/threonine protein phosphatase PrpC
MSRSLGDKIAHSVGVIDLCDTSRTSIKFDKYEYIIVNASDGLWDYVSLERVKDIVEKRKNMGVENLSKKLARVA